MSKKTELCGNAALSEQVEAKEKAQIMLQKLQALKNRVSELRAQCEKLQKISEDRDNALLCDGCGGAIEPEQGIEAKNFGQEARHYHKECFRKLWL
jgi:hypothetical protein